MFRHQDHHSSAYFMWWCDIYQCKLSPKIWILYRKQHKSTKDTICAMHIWQQSLRLLQLISADHHGACHMDTQWHRIYNLTHWGLVMDICISKLDYHKFLWEQSLWGQHGAHLGPTRPRWAPCWPYKPCYLGHVLACQILTSSQLDP